MTAAKLDVSTLLDDDVMWTLLGTLYLRAYESRSPRSILHDHYAAEVLERIEYDERSLARRLAPKSSQFLVALRGTRFDRWLLAFLDRHPDATVLQLGCGLDSRWLRLDLPKTVRWYDLDLPEVIAVRRQLFDEHDRYRMIAASVTDSGWLADVPADRPVLILAEGLFPYLEPADVRALLQRLTDHFTEGGLIFDVSARWPTRFSKVAKFGLRDGTELERWNRRLVLVERVPLATLYPLVHEPATRRIYRVLNAVPVLRDTFAYYRYAFASSQVG